MALPVVWAQPGDGSKSGSVLLQEAKILYDNLQYREALTKLKSAIQVRGNKRSDIVEIYKYMGFAYIALGKKKHAHRAFELLLKVNPNYEMNPLLTSPKILNYFNQVRDELRKKDRVIMQHTPVTDSPASKRIEVKAYVVDLQKKLKEMKLYFRRRGDPNYSIADMNATRDASKGRGAMTYVGAIPFIWTLYEETELFVDYYIAGLDDRGNWVANAGTPKEPISFRINLMSGELPEGTRRTPLVKSWWFWTLIGVGVAGLSVGGYFIINEATKPPGLPDYGEAVLVFH
jgi:tetratricopeptide (TPR) repeat protein